MAILQPRNTRSDRTEASHLIAKLSKVLLTLSSKNTNDKEKIMYKDHTHPTNDMAIDNNGMGLEKPEASDEGFSNWKNKLSIKINAKQ